MQTWIKRLHRVEDALLVLLLTTMIILASAQILLRNLFEFGFIWIDPLLRAMVLWLGLIGATIATREDRHIRIDLLTRTFSRNTHRLIQFLVGQFSAWICLLIAWYGAGWIRLDFEDGVIAFAGIPAWVLEVIVPISFALIGVRFILKSIFWLKLYIRHLKIAARHNH